MSTEAHTRDFAREDGWPTFSKPGWTAAEYDAAQNTRRFTPRQLELLIGLIEKTKQAGLAVTEITREVFDHPELADSFAEWVRLFKDGQGLFQLQGFPVHELPEDDIWRMFWGIGSHFGIGVSQNTKGDLLGKVTVTPGIVTGRVYGTSTMAPLHADRIDMLTLLCIDKAKSGGENVFVSMLKVWDVIAAERPDLLLYLLRGYPQQRLGEQPEGCMPFTPYRVPVLGEAEGLRSAYLGGNSMLSQIELYFSELLQDIDREALHFLAEVLKRPELQLHQTLEPGEAVFINNMEMAHSRTAFEDGDGPHEKRLLLRMWLQGRPKRPIPQDMRVINNPDGNLGIWPQAAAAKPDMARRTTGPSSRAAPASAVRDAIPLGQIYAAMSELSGTPPDPEQALRRQTMALLEEIGGQMAAFVATLATTLGLYRTDVTILLLLAVVGRGAPLKASQLQKAVGFTPGGMTRRLDSLEQRGLVRRLPDSDDNRAWLVELTAEGQRLAALGVEQNTSRNHRLLAEFSLPEWGQMVSLLSRLKTALAQD